MKVLFIGDIFGQPGIICVQKHLPTLIKDHQIDFVIAQGENVTGRKGLNKADYLLLKAAGVNGFTMGNHIWANEEIYQFIDEVDDIVRPLNVDFDFGKGSRVFKINNETLRVTSLLGQSFLQLHTPWKQKQADSFFDSMDEILKTQPTDYHLVDFHAETTSEKNVLGIYLDGKVSAMVGTHTHVQTNDSHILPKGTAYITDVGMTGPINCAIGANFDEVYLKMRFGGFHTFRVSDNHTQFNGVILTFSPTENKIEPLNF